MAKIHTLKISNYRSLKSFEQVFGKTDFVCLIGRGDSGKTTILEAIAAVLSPSWNTPFYDTDFYNGDLTNSIEIEASLYDLPKTLLSGNKFTSNLRFLNGKDEIIDDVFDEELKDDSGIMTIKLIVERDLEPKWFVVNDRLRNEPIEIRANDRASLNVFLVSDYIDRHFSWSKGNPLYSLLKEDDPDIEKTTVILDTLREAKDQIKPTSFSHLDNVAKRVEVSASSLGINITDSNTTIDFKDILIKDGRVCLHNDKIPFRLKGKGAKRLISIAIQMELVQSGGILLIDEIEQGLEPDRAQHLARELKTKNKGQVFITTHSSNVLVELNADNLFRVKNSKEGLLTFDKSFQGCLRNNPEAFFSKKVLICEGATEVGICRAINEFRISKGKSSFSLLGIGIVDGSGSSFIKYCKDFIKAEIKTCTLCDSDTEINLKKSELKNLGVVVIDCDENNAIETQIFKDLNWAGIIKLIEYISTEKGVESIKQLVENQFEGKLPIDWNIEETTGIRKALAEASTLKKPKVNNEILDKAWFKRIDHGAFLGRTICENLVYIEGKKLEKQIAELFQWIDNA